MPTRGSNAALIGMDQRIGIALARQRAHRIARHHRSFVRESGSNVEIHQASIQFRDGRAVFPAHSGIQGEGGADAPIVGEKGVIERVAKIFVGVAERDGGSVGNAQQKIREIRSGGGAGERKRPASVLLPEHIELLPLEVAAKLKIVARAIPKESGGNRVRLIMVDGLLGIGKRLDAAEKIRLGGPQSKGL